MESAIYSQIMYHLKRAKAPLIVSDRRTDGDSLGASIALAHFLRDSGVPARVYLSEKLPEQYKRLPGVDWCFDGSLKGLDCDLLVICDCSEEKYLQEVLAEISPKPFVINIDHHATNPGFGDLKLIIPESPATSELVFLLFNETSTQITAEMALCLMVGLGFDTTFFRNGATNDRAYNMASGLLRCGVRIPEVLRILHSHRGAQVLKLWGTALSRLRQHKDLGIVSTCLTQRDFSSLGLEESTAEGLSDFLGLSLAPPALMVFRETSDGNVKVSMRTRTGDVSKLARAFGGGGHKKAAGFTLFDKSLKQMSDGSWKVVSNS